MTPWDTVPAGPVMHLHGAGHDPFFDHSIYRTPITKRIRSPYDFAETADAQFPRLGYAAPRSHTEALESLLPSDASTAMTEIGDEDGQKLKGTIWPGMAMFDSATPEQKRKRNQRKDTSVLEQMKVLSQSIAAMECVWGAEGLDFQRARDIYASPSVEGSPVATPTRKRKYRARRRSPTVPDAANTVKSDEADDTKKKRRARRVPLADVTNMRQTRAAARSAGGQNKQSAVDLGRSPTIKMDDVNDVKIPTGRPAFDDSFDIFQDIPTHSPGEPLPSATLRLWKGGVLTRLRRSLCAQSCRRYAGEQVE